jgi:DNA-binding transcriptional ArsR family regulator
MPPRRAAARARSASPRRGSAQSRHGEAFRAVADPTRRAMLDLLRDGERSVGSMCERFDITQPAVSQHLKVLREAGLVSVRRDGRIHYYRLEPLPLREVARWLDHYEQFWDDKLEALGTYLDARARKGDDDAT